MVLKCADIGHLAAPPRTHRRWAFQLEEEFFRQVAYLPARSTKNAVLATVHRLTYATGHHLHVIMNATPNLLVRNGLILVSFRTQVPEAEECMTPHGFTEGLASLLTKVMLLSILVPLKHCSMQDIYMYIYIYYCAVLGCSI